MKTRVHNILFLLFFAITVIAQKPNKCATNHLSISKDIYSNHLLKEFANTDPLHDIKPVAFNAIIHIPVVVHVIHNNINNIIGGFGNTNISNEQILSQIEALNNDYRKKPGTLGFNNSIIGSDMKIEFYLANLDPNGNATSGINRIYSADSSFNINYDWQKLSQLAYWSSAKYLNIWVASLQDDYLGMGQFPNVQIEGLNDNFTDDKIDGVVIESTIFGNKKGTVTDPIYGNGRTLTHEIGHWLGLLHTWGDEFCGTDFIDDTPQCEDSNSSGTCNPIYSNCTGSKSKNMIENYMDYSPDSCMNIFTNDQMIRVRQVLNLSQRRNSLIQDANPNLFLNDNLKITLLENPSNSDKVRIFISSPQSNKINYVIYDATGKNMLEGSYDNEVSKYLEFNKNLFKSGVYYLNVGSNSSKILIK